MEQLWTNDRVRKATGVTIVVASLVYAGWIAADLTVGDLCCRFPSCWRTPFLILLLFVTVHNNWHLLEVGLFYLSSLPTLVLILTPACCLLFDVRMFSEHVVAHVADSIFYVLLLAAYMFILGNGILRSPALRLHPDIGPAAPGRPRPSSAGPPGRGTPPGNEGSRGPWAATSRPCTR